MSSPRKMLDAETRMKLLSVLLTKGPQDGQQEESLPADDLPKISDERIKLVYEIIMNSMSKELPTARYATMDAALQRVCSGSGLTGEVDNDKTVEGKSPDAYPTLSKTLTNVSNGSAANDEICANCETMYPNEMKNQLSWCTGCKEVYYCSRHCQKIDWKVAHRNKCISKMNTI